MSSCCSSAPASGPSESSTGWMRLAIAGLVAGQSMIFGLAASISPPTGTARLVIHGALAVSAVAVFLLAGKLGVSVQKLANALDLRSNP